MEEILTRSADPIKVKLIKGQRDAYGWEISIQGNDADKILEEVYYLNDRLRGDSLQGKVGVIDES